LKKKSQESAGGVAQGVGPEFKLQYCEKKNQNPKKPKNPNQKEPRASISLPPKQLGLQT
jgi:hypothetical protein